MSAKPLRFTAKLSRTDPRLGLFFYVPADVVAQWGLAHTATIEGEVAGHPLGRRGLKDCGPKNPDWYVELTKAITEAIDGKEGEVVEVELRLADMTMPSEMTALMKSDTKFAAAWNALKPSHKRAAHEYYVEAKTPKGRTARLEKISRSIKAS